MVSKKNKEDNVLHEPLLNDRTSRSSSSSSSSSSNSSIRSCSREHTKGDNSTPLSNANFFSALTFSWIGPLLAVGNEKQLNLEDVPPLGGADSANGIYPIVKSKLDSYSSDDGEVSSLKLAKALIFSIWREILWTAILTFVFTCCSYVGPYLIDTFVQYVNGRRNYKYEGYVLVSVFIVSKFVECFCERHTSFKSQQIGLRVRAALAAMIYRKAQTLSIPSRQVHTSGEVINFMVVDAVRVSGCSWVMHNWWTVPLQIVLALLILYRNLGLASIAAFFATVLTMLVNFPVGKCEEYLQKKLMEAKDGRVTTTSEVLRNMKILKLQGWEMKFLARIVALRENEEGWLRKFLFLAAASTVIFYAAPMFVSIVTFVTCVLIGIPLESGKILSALAIFSILRVAIYNLPQTISVLAEAKVSLDRISSFLRLNDLPPDMVEKLPDTSKVVIEINNGNFTWDPPSHPPTLRNVNLQVFRGMRVGVCGTVGSGKSSLLSCILGEMPKVSGNIRLCGTKAYVAQSPWIQSGKVEENILFGKEMNRERYERVLDVCSLKKDLEILSFGDQTIVGERGINLSGGQKQRIQIARALYQDADIYLFDDPFSALDAHTGMHLYKECLLGFLSSKTVVYATNQVEFLPSADLILVLNDGIITHSGKYNEILTSTTGLMELVGAHKKALYGSTNFGTEKGGQDNEDVTNSDEENGNAEEDTEQKPQTSMDELLETEAQLVQEEEREKGRVNFHVYWKYLTIAYRGTFVPIILVIQVLFQLLQIRSNFWMAQSTPVSKDAESPVKSSTLILVYVALSVVSCICLFLRGIVQTIAGYKTATLLFKKMHLCLFRAPMSFFDATPSGRIINRASTDQTDVDLGITTMMGGTASTTISLLGIIGVMSRGAWQVFIIFFPVLGACIWYQQYYIAAARELVRLAEVCRAPLVQHLTESISGMTTIRSFDQEPRFMETNLKLADNWSRPDFYAVGAMEWLGFHLDMLSSITFAVCLIFLISVPEGVIDPSIAGLAVTYGLNLNILQATVVWYFGMLESKIICVERILQYTCIPSEPPLVIEAHRPDHNWPSHGEVAIRNLKVRYASHMPLILRGLTCTFPGGKKSGIVGRTGSGKSTLVQTLFRIVEPAAGQIFIDGVDISKIGLHDLRSRLSIIPQDPTMFEGTVRSNLDPLEEYSDEQIWEALDKCQLGEEVRKEEMKLDSLVTANGENWSMGQRQLVCLGRVLLKRSKILVLDEATSSVDTATDSLIQKTLREHFSESTVITIAHRITSVLDSDMVLVLDNGLVVEYDMPKTLLKKKSSSFGKLVAEHFEASRTN